MKYLIRPLLCALLSLPVLPYPVWAAETPAPMPASGSDGSMIDISAEQSLEWHQDSRLYVARGKAKAIRDGMAVEADLLTAHQRDSKGKPAAAQKGQMATDIDVLTAEGNVFIHDAKQQVFGERAIYDFDKKLIKITGDNLKYVTEKNVVTARDSLEYLEDKKIAIARGRAIGEHMNSRVEADVLSAHFGTTPQGQMEMTAMTARGNVIIVTKDGGVSRGDTAVYDTKRNIATLSNNVRITRGKTQLAGDKAEVDFASGQSRLLSSGGGGRVRAVLAPSSKNEKTKP